MPSGEGVQESRFWKALEEIFVGVKVEGESGFVRLLRIKSAYFQKSARPALESNIDRRAPDRGAFREELFEKLHAFFSRFFCESGSIYFRRVPTWQKVYQRVYEDGRDVALVWKTRGLFYVKSDTLVCSMTIPVHDQPDGFTPAFIFEFDASEIKNNKSNERRDFVFEYAGFVWNDDIPAIKASVSYSENGRKTDVHGFLRSAHEDGVARLREDHLERACRAFLRQTEADYFIHKDAGGFLRGQFDAWFYQFVFDKENEFTSARFTQLQSIRNTAFEIIEFIAQFEDELAHIWKKPKFARNVHYVVTADRLSPDLRKKIAADAGMKAQLDEWRKLHIAPESFSDEAFSDGEATHKFLPIDTRHFAALEDAILAQFANLAAALDGEMWCGENWQALNTLKTRFAGRAQCVYIDPPYNTSNDKHFEYKDEFESSSWLTMMHNRLELAKIIMADSGYFYLQLDHYADYLGRFLLQQVFFDVKPEDQTVLTWNTGDNISGFKTQRANWIRQADKILFFPKNAEKARFFSLWQPLKEHIQQRVGWLDFIGANKNDLYVEKWRDGKLCQESISVPSKRIGTIWNDVYSFQYSEVRETESFGFRTQKPENLLRRMIQSCSACGETVIDYFAGSGTTPSVAHKLGRKWLAIEAGKHFANLYCDNGGSLKVGMLGRLKIVLAGDRRFRLPDTEVTRRPHLSQDVNWKGGGFFKYGEFEQYEETLAKSSYKDDEMTLFDAGKTPLQQYVFLSDDKFANVVKVATDKLDISLDSLYPGIDIAESLSNILGKEIKSRNADAVTFVDGETRKINPKRMNEAEKLEFIDALRPYIWWGEQ